PQRGEYANEAYFLTMPQMAELVEIQVIHTSINALALSTDGLLRLALKLPSYEPHAPFFKPLFEFVSVGEETVSSQAQLFDFLASPRVCSRTDDDKTLVLVGR
ncbi:MAG TPA: protein phosphatase 2C domain-containing protein, partial [Anaerolineae bacterium]